MLERLLRLAFVRRRVVLLAALGLIAVSLLLVSRLSFDANIMRLLPRKGPAVRSFDTYLRHFGTFDHIYVLFEVPPGSRISDAEEFVGRYVEQLRKAPEIASVDAELFDEVKDWNYLLDRELLLLGPDQIPAALARFDPANMGAELARSRSLLTVSSPEVKAYVQQDPLGLLSLLRDRLGRGRALVDFDPTQKGYVSRDGRSRLVMAKPVRPPFDTAFCKGLFERLTQVEAAARSAPADADPEAEPPTPVTVQVAGGYRLALEAERVISRELIVNALSSLAGLLLLVLIALRSLQVVLYGAVPLVLAGLFTLGVNGLAGPLSPVASGSAGMLFGLGVDGVVLLYLRYLEERANGFGAEDALGRSAGTAGSVTLAYATTAGTFFALTVVDFPSLHELGLIVGFGILACCALLLVLLPAMVGFTSARQVRPIQTAWLGRFVERRGRAILAVSVVLTVGLGVAAARLRLNTSLEKLQAHTQGTDLEQEVADRFALPREVLIALGEGPQLDALLASAHRLGASVERDLPSLVVASPDTVLPPASQQARRSEQLAHARLDTAGVSADLEREAAAAGFRPGIFQPFLQRLPRMLDPSTRLTYAGLVEHGLDALLSRYVTKGRQGYIIAVYLYPKTPGDLDRLAALAARAAPSFTLTGVPFVNRELAARFMPQFIWSVTLGGLVVALLVYAAFRNVRDTLLAFLPTVLGFVWSAGLLALFGVELDLFSLFAAMTFIGIATDYAIHVIYRHTIEGTRPMRAVLTATGAGVLLACGTTLIGFGSLINSSYGPLRSFGITAVATIASCLVAALLTLPAFLQETERA